MARKRSKRTSVAAIIFVLVVTQIGIGIKATGHLSNPFQVFGQIAHLHLDFSSPGEVQERRPEIQAAAPGVIIVDGGLSEIRWSQFSRVLFDWWFIAAITALVIVIGRPIGFVFKQMRTLLKKPRPTTPSMGESQELKTTV